MIGKAACRRTGAALAAAGLCAFGAQAQAPAVAAAPQSLAPHVYGHIERALVTTGSNPLQVHAQLEGGGEATVLYVTDIKYASGEGGMFAHFTIDNGEVMPGRSISLALPVIKDHLVRGRDGAVAHHPVVAIGFCIGTVAFTSNVFLEPRTTYTPQLLLGKADAAQFAPVDPQKKDTGDPNCAAPGSSH
jgi:hypothetical protein